MVHTKPHHLLASPSLLRLFSKALLPKKQPSNSDDTRQSNANPSIIPELSFELAGIRIDERQLTYYRHVCGFDSKAHLPSIYPHILAFPLHMQLLSDASFPLPLLGLVHVSNSINSHRPLNAHELFDITCTLSNSCKVNRGIQFDINTQVFVSGRLVWEETSTLLHRSKKVATGRQSRTALPSYLNNETWKLNSQLGRQYAKASGDINLIHLYPWSAKLFGFERAIAHGMWSKTRCIGALTDAIEGRPFKAEVDFKLPIYLPGTVNFNWQKENQNIHFQLLDKNMEKPHLKGLMTLL